MLWLHGVSFFPLFLLRFLRNYSPFAHLTCLKGSFSCLKGSLPCLRTLPGKLCWRFKKHYIFENICAAKPHFSVHFCIIFYYLPVVSMCFVRCPKYIPSFMTKNVNWSSVYLFSKQSLHFIPLIAQIVHPSVYCLIYGETGFLFLFPAVAFVYQISCAQVGSHGGSPLSAAVRESQNNNNNPSEKSSLGSARAVPLETL